MNLIKKYTEFIFENLNIPSSVELPQILSNGDIMNVKVGIVGKIDVDVSLKEKNDRFLVFEIRFDKYSEQLELFVSRKKSPEILINEFHNKLKSLVKHTLLSNNEHDLINKINEDIIRSVFNLRTTH